MIASICYFGFKHRDLKWTQFKIIKINSLFLLILSVKHEDIYAVPASLLELFKKKGLIVPEIKSPKMICEVGFWTILKSYLLHHENWHFHIQRDSFICVDHFATKFQLISCWGAPMGIICLLHFPITE